MGCVSIEVGSRCLKPLQCYFKILVCIWTIRNKKSIKLETLVVAYIQLLFIAQYFYMPIGFRSFPVSFAIRYSPWTERAFRTCRTRVLERLLPRGSEGRPVGTARSLGCCQKVRGSQRCSGRFLSSWVPGSAPAGCSDAGVGRNGREKKGTNWELIMQWIKK